MTRKEVKTMSNPISQKENKAPVNLSIQTSNGVEVRKKFATSKVLRFGMILYAAFLLRMCLMPGGTGTTNKQPTEPVNAGQGIEYVVPSNPDIYSARDLDFKKGNNSLEVSKDGMPIGYMTEAYVLEDHNNKVVGYITNSQI